MNDEEIRAFVKISKVRVEKSKRRINELTNQINRIFIG